MLPELWPDVLHRLSVLGGGFGTAMISMSRGEWRWSASEGMRKTAEDYMAGDWSSRTNRMERLLRARHAGFLGDLDVYTLEEMDRDPIFTEFHRPRGGGWGVATALPMPTGDMVVFDVERMYAAGPVDPDTVKRLDVVRPHLARASLISIRLGLERARAAAAVLELVGLPAAILGRDLRLLEANAGLGNLIPGVVQDRVERVKLVDKNADRMLASALQTLSSSRALDTVRSIPVPGSRTNPPLIMHVVPLRRAAHDIFLGSSAVLVVTPIEPGQIADTEVLQGLFDLSAAEARVARAIAELRTVDQAALHLGVTRETIRTQLRSALAKTGLSRQAELASLLAGSRLRRRLDTVE